MSSLRVYLLVAAAAIVAGSTMWWAGRPAGTAPPRAQVAVTIAPGPLFAASFRDTAGAPHSLAELDGRLIVINFWATWCAPCREEVPAFVRLQAAWKDRGVRFVGLANDDPGKVESFARELSVNYPLWVGGDEVSELSRRLGNPQGSLPHTVIVSREGEVKQVKVGAYSDASLDAVLERLSANIR